MGKSYIENVDQKSFLILANNPKQPLHVRNHFKIRQYERGLTKSIKNLTLFIYLFLNPVPFNGQDYEKQRGPRIRDQSPFTKQVQNDSFISDVLLAQV